MGHGGRMRGSTDSVKHGRYWLDIMRNFFPHEDSQAVEWATQERCAVSIPGDFQDLTRGSPEQPGQTSELPLL